MSGSNHESGRVSRRAVLLTGALGAAGLLTGCGVHLEDDAPRIPFVPTAAPTRQPVPDETTLRHARARARSLRQRAEAVGGPLTALPAQLAGLHAKQLSSLTRLLEGLGVPLPAETTGTATPTTPSATPSGGRPAHREKRPAHRTKVEPADLRALAAAERRDVDLAHLRRLADVSSTNVALLASLAAQHHAAAHLLGAVRLASAGPRLPGPTGDAAARLLDAVRSAVYGFQVVTARTPPRQRDDSGAAATLTTLQDLSSTLTRLAGDSAATPPLAYRLPFRVDDEASRTRLARHLLTALTASAAAQFTGATGDADGLTGLVLVTSQSVVLGRAFGVPLAPFPGLETPRSSPLRSDTSRGPRTSTPRSSPLRSDRTNTPRSKPSP